MKKQAALLSLSLLVASSLSIPAGALGAAAPVAPAAAESQPAADSGSAAGQHAIMIPLRYAAELLGARVEWNEGERSATAARGASTLKVWIGSAEAELNGAKLSLDAPVQLVNEQTVIPLAVLEQFAGSALSWDGQQPVAQDDLSLKGTAYVYHLLHGDGERLAAGSSAALTRTFGTTSTTTALAQIQALAAGHPKLLQAKTEENGVHTNVLLDYELDIPPGRITMVLRFDKQGLVDDLNAYATTESLYQPAVYDDPSLYTEREMVVGEGDLALPGALTLPKGDGPFPLVILVHGSGPNDRDETIGGAKPFRDLAAGLAGKGIAVLRYDKVTAEHTLKVAALPRFSLEDETVADALRAVELAKTLKEIDPDNIFIAGHSQGGYAVPLMLGQPQGASIKGAVLLSAPSGNISQVLVEQQEVALQLLKEAGQPEALIAQQQAAVAAYKSMVETIQNPAYSVDRLPEQFPLGDPYWWIEQRDYQPAELAQSQTTPLFIAQGENDWQVSMKQFEGWKAALQNRANVTYASYPSVNHLLAEYGSISMGLEYGQPSNVAASLVEDVAEWVNKQAE
ncbi:alpha/beta fold hydrolase [Paenibacillus sp. YN15]|uniref:alpha/beta hydrolase family protein n=1 Tax=Paenibacillus sp. YN15 TaxID=1742774 RepID=UPI000DCC1C1B|nr:alpha/beta fold hydrolase [Paenibacillus sp. YN15]RAV04038.1 hypothetical protein DQG13_06040 [Paenibacillus sp. YN15]